MCFNPTADEVASSRAREDAFGDERVRDVSFSDGAPADGRVNPAHNPGPRGNQEPDRGELAKSLDKLEAVLPH